ncbi:MAG: TetR/AcrR family transcriptional regulator [Pseudomonadota bacterium]
MAKRREMNPEGKRSSIMEAAEKLFVAHGYTGTSIADVAKEADVAVGSVYRLFPDKPALLAALHERMEEAFIAAMEEGWNSVEGYPDRFEPMISSIFDKVAELRSVMPLYAMTKDMIGAADYQPGAKMIKRIAELYGHGVTAGALRAIPPSIQAPLGHAMVEGGMRAWMSDPLPEKLVQVKAEVTEVFRRAFVLRG